MSEAAKIGSSEWFSDQADKLIGFGLDVLKTELQGVNSSGGGTGTTPADSFTSGLADKLPYILGAVAVVGIGIILWKR